MTLPDVDAFIGLLGELQDADWQDVNERVQGRLAPVRMMILAPILSPVWILERMLTMVALATGQTRRAVAPPGLLEAMQAGQQAENVARAATAPDDAVRAAGMAVMATALAHRIGETSRALAPVAESIAGPLLAFFPRLP